MTPESSTSDLARAVQEVAERTQGLVREEIELAKAEISTKARKLARGAAIGAAAAVFVLAGLIYLLHSASWFAWDVTGLSGERIWVGYLIVAGVLFLLGVLAGMMAARLFKTGAPTPDMAIEEGKLIRDTLSGDAPPTLGRPGT